jgi:hypothetical protein
MERKRNFEREKIKVGGEFGENGRNKIFGGMWAHKSWDLGAQVIVVPLRIKKNSATWRSNSRSLSNSVP